MSKTNELAFAAMASSNGTIRTQQGMSIRCYLAGQAMRALIPLWQSNGDTHSRKVAEQAFEYADALIAELEKTEK